MKGYTIFHAQITYVYEKEGLRYWQVQVASPIPKSIDFHVLKLTNQIFYR